jgi:hypothetical protein
VTPNSFSAAHDLLVGLGAPRRLLRHIELVHEAADVLLRKLAALSVPIRADFVRAGVALHDSGKVVHPAELDAPGGFHEPDGEALLLRAGVSPELARVCMSHARWETMDVSLEELVIALADKLWKGVRNPRLEERCIDAIAAVIGQARWDVFFELDSCFESSPQTDRPW